MNQIDHAAKMAQQDPDFPDYDERGWPAPLVCAVSELREHAARLREIGAKLRSTNALRATSIEVLADSLDYSAAPAERYMAENTGPGLGMQVLGTVETTDTDDVAVLECRSQVPYAGADSWESLAHIGPNRADGQIEDYAEGGAVYRGCDLRIRWLGLPARPAMVPQVAGQEATFYFQREELRDAEPHRPQPTQAAATDARATACERNGEVWEQPGPDAMHGGPDGVPAGAGGQP